MGTKIEWTDETWNPVVGCSKVSEGCQNCYAEKMACRLAYMGQEKYQRVISAKAHSKEGKQKWTGDINCREAELNKPLHWKKPRRIFVCSMGDLFHEKVPDVFIYEVIQIIKKCHQHIFQILTKRPEGMAAWDWRDYNAKGWFLLPNVHLGVTCENQRGADERIPILLQIPAAKRFVSFEPLLEGIHIENLVVTDCADMCPEGNDCSECNGFRKNFEFPLIDQIIIGCESGPKRRPCKLEWVESLIDQADAAGVKVFVKQLSINGKVSHEPKEWPEKFRRRELI